MKITENPRIYKQAQSSLPAESKYSVSLKPDIRLPAAWNSTAERFVDVEEVGDVRIPFRIDVEAREWGIKGIVVNVEPVQVAVEIVVLDSKRSGEEKYVKTITFDPSQIKMWMEGGSTITITGLELSLNEDFSVNYETSALVGTTLMRSAE